MNINCMNDKIANAKNPLRPVILRAILNIYQNGNHQISAQMVKIECGFIESTISWNNKIPAICNAMRNVLDCGGEITGENRDFNGFTIAFGDNIEVVSGDSQIKNNSSESKVKAEGIKKKSVSVRFEKKNNAFIKKEVPQKIVNEKKLTLTKNFKVVMICSKGKNKSNFKNYPTTIFKAVSNSTNEFHPDDLMPHSNKKWRNFLIENQKDENLLKAYELYTRKEYKYLYEKFKKSFYILSAGWGLISSEFKLPNYDITFSQNANIGAKRGAKINELTLYDDDNQISKNDNEDIVFIGTPDYIPLFIRLTQNLSNRKIIYWKSKTLKRISPNDTFKYRYFQTNINTNWHYELACVLASGIVP